MSSKIVFQKRHTRYKALESTTSPFNMENLDKHLFTYQTESLSKLIKNIIPTAKIKRRQLERYKGTNGLYHFYVSFDDEADEAFFLMWSCAGVYLED